MQISIKYTLFSGNSLFQYSFFGICFFSFFLGVHAQDDVEAVLTSSQVIVGVADMPLLATTFVGVPALPDVQVQLTSACRASFQSVPISRKRAAREQMQFFFVRYTSLLCSEDKIGVFVDGSQKTTLSVQISSSQDILRRYLDLSSEDLVWENRAHLAAIQKSEPEESVIQKMQQAYDHTHAYYGHILIRDLLEKRANISYITPVAGAELPIYPSYLPNASRSYRQVATDGIHQSWDFYTPNYTPVRAVEDGIILRVVDTFTWDDFEKISTTYLTTEKKALNLDIYRGNQIWLQTLDGNVFFYNHLDRVEKNVFIGKQVSRGDLLGVTGTTGVPDPNYTDYHLDISLMLNPYIKEKAGEYSFLDIMLWDWFGKGQTRSWIIDHQTPLFILD